MAEIPVERKSGGVPWWVWLLGLLALLLLLGLLLRGCSADNAVVGNANTNNANGNANANGNTVASATTTTTTNTNTNGNSNSGNTNNAGNANNSNTVAAGNAFTDIGTFANSTNKASFIGQRAQLNNVRVQRVLSDRAFTVGPARGQELYVILDDSLNEGGSDRKFRIEEGQTLTIAGPMEKPPTAEVKEEERKPGDIKLNPAEEAEMRKQQVYLHANKIEKGGVVEGSK